LFLSIMSARMGGDREFIEQYTDFVRGVAAQTRRQLNVDCPLEDLVGFGFAGLLEARQRFDASKGVGFKSFAYYRVRGAVLDGIRAMAYLPRRAHARLRALETLDSLAEGELEGSAGAPPLTAPSVEGRLRALDGLMGRVAAAYTVAHSAEDGHDTTFQSPDARLFAQERRAAVEQALAGLEEREAFILRGHYMEGRRFDELARELGMSKSWVSRVHGKALDRLRELLGGEM
jgi:RNA polymerase sigma factor for flagellar operon FliA